MNILVLGSGGREHAISWKISQSEKCSNLYIAPGNAGTGLVGNNLSVNINDFEEEKSKNKYSLKKIQTRKNNLHYATCLKLPQIKNNINKNLLVFFKLKPTKTFSCIFTLTNNKKIISRVNFLDKNYFEFK